MSVLKSNKAGLEQIRISRGLFGLAAGIPGGTNGFGCNTGSVKGEAKVAVPPQVREKGAVVLPPAPTQLSKYK